jgi:hypothetical protein
MAKDAASQRLVHVHENNTVSNTVTGLPLCDGRVNSSRPGPTTRSEVMDGSSDTRMVVPASETSCARCTSAGDEGDFLLKIQPGRILARRRHSGRGRQTTPGPGVKRLNST